MTRLRGTPTSARRDAVFLGTQHDEGIEDYGVLYVGRHGYATSVAEFHSLTQSGAASAAVWCRVQREPSLLRQQSGISLYRTPRNNSRRSFGEAR